MYSKSFPHLVPRITTIDQVFENILNSQNELFKHLYHPSEDIYRQWIYNFNSCNLIIRINEEMLIDIDKCKNSLNEFKTWVVKYPQAKGNSIEYSIRKELGELPFDKPVTFNPRNASIKEEIYSQLKRYPSIEISTNRDPENRIEISLKDSNIILVRKRKYPVTPSIFQNWLQQFGIYTSITTMTYLIENGMIYSSQTIKLNSLLNYTDRGYGVIGILAFRLKILISNVENSEPFIDFNRHPLRQSVVLALARLEYYLNPKLV